MSPLSIEYTLSAISAGLRHLSSNLFSIRSIAGASSFIDDIINFPQIFVSALFVAIVISVFCAILGQFTGRHSWVDKIWSIVPILYCWHFVWHSASLWNIDIHPRVVIASSLITVWGIRLTYNFARKGGYHWAEEDYRWPYIRERLHPFAMFILNIVFIAFIQNILLLALTAPIYIAACYPGTSLNALDATATVLTLGALVLEAVADQQQWNFQKAKYAMIRQKKKLTKQYASGFLKSGLFKYSRHPNFLGEQLFWFGIYVYSVAACGVWVQWSMIGAVSLILLFQASTALTEKISVSKYPEYVSYIRTTSRFIPLPPATKSKKEE